MIIDMTTDSRLRSVRCEMEKEGANLGCANVIYQTTRHKHRTIPPAPPGSALRFCADEERRTYHVDLQLQTSISVAPARGRPRLAGQFSSSLFSG